MEIVVTRVRINKIENRKTKEAYETKSLFFETTTLKRETLARYEETIWEDLSHET